MHEQFLADIIAHPERDDVRLIYADWLQDNGQPERSEFIRCQIQLAIPGWDVCACVPSRWPGRKYECQACALRRREGDLLGMHAWEWQRRDLGDLAALATRYRRGFVAEITCTLAAWCGERCGICQSAGYARSMCTVCHGSGITGRYAPALMRAAPLEYVRLSDREPIQGEPADGPPGWAWMLESWDHEGTYLRLHECPRQFEPFLLEQANGGYLCHSEGAVVFPTRQAALDALSVACLQWGRYAAELEDVQSERLDLHHRIEDFNRADISPLDHQRAVVDQRFATLRTREADLTTLVEGSL